MRGGGRNSDKMLKTAPVSKEQVRKSRNDGNLGESDKSPAPRAPPAGHAGDRHVPPTATPMMRDRLRK